MIASCPFCAKVTSSDVVLQNDAAVALDDGFPVSQGHSLIVPRRHEADFFALTATEQAAMLELLRLLQARIAERHHADGFNVGINVGSAAGQTVDHVHVHLIPRYRGDVPDPRGGVRWVIPQNAPYWARK